ncbi:MAG TPA: PHP domain-containing protein [bacterium]|nr:PHP domain-containing protein [bacterium]HPQ66543.1 PHP domain-containing protein [bacterium]
MIRSRGIDLHVHTRASDGLLSPAEVVALARRLRLGALAVTDHDTVAGLDEALAAGSKEKVKVVPGVEISVDHPVGSIHMVGLFIDHGNVRLREWLGTLLESRLERLPKIVARLRELGIDISREEVEAEAAGGVVGRAHVARVLKAKGVVRGMEEAFRRFLGRGASAYVPRRKVPAAEAIELIHRAGGVAVLAHYTTCCGGDRERESALIREITALGLDGMETYYHSFSRAEHLRARELAREFRLLEAGGSDFHGPPGPVPRLGSPRIPWSVYSALRRSARRHARRVRRSGPARRFPAFLRQ